MSVAKPEIMSVANIMLSSLHSGLDCTFSLPDEFLVKLSEYELTIYMCPKEVSTLFDNVVIKWTEYHSPEEVYKLFENIIITWVAECVLLNVKHLTFKKIPRNFMEYFDDNFEKNLLGNLENLQNKSPEFYSKFSTLFLEMFDKKN
jgi:hypothetical protein